MARKLAVRIQQWLPVVAVTFMECEPFDLLSVAKYSGKPLVVIGSGPEQLVELVSVMDFLVENGFLTKKQSDRARYFGVDFQNFEYSPEKSFSELINKLQAKPSSQDSRNTPASVVINQKNYAFNLNLALDKLIEVNPSIFSL